MLYYQPTEAAAHESVERIMTEVPYGWLVRSVHVWGANFFIAVVVLHFLVEAVHPGVSQAAGTDLALRHAAAVSAPWASASADTCLPWNELSYYATLVGTQIPGTVPVVGDLVVHFLRGGEQVTGDTITRFFAAHVMFLPLACGLLLAVHLALVQAQGMSLPLGMTKKKVRDDMPFFSEFLLIESCVWLVLFGAIVTLAVCCRRKWASRPIRSSRAARASSRSGTSCSCSRRSSTFPRRWACCCLPWGPSSCSSSLSSIERPCGRRGAPGSPRVFVLLVVYAAVFEVRPWRPRASNTRPARRPDCPRTLPETSRGLPCFWAVIGFLAFYLVQLFKENARVRRLYRGGGE